MLDDSNREEVELFTEFRTVPMLEKKLVALNVMVATRPISLVTPILAEK
jgi:hypothetical protein